MDKIILNRLCLVVLSFVSVFVAMEIALRVMPKTHTSDPMGDRSRVFYAPDDAQEHIWGHSYSNALRIAVIGDSFAQGEGVQVDYRYGDCLERLLNTRTNLPAIDVEVFAQCGTSTFQQIGLLEDALKWKANIVILGICLNDMEDWANPKELYRWRSTLLPETPPLWLARILRYSRALSWIYTRSQQVETHRNELKYYQRLYNPSYSGVKRFQEAIAIMNLKCHEANAVFIPMIFPLLSESFQKGAYPFEYAHEAIHSRCDELHIKHLDLLPFFRGASPERMQVIPRFDPHPSEIAHRMAAESLLEYLLAQRVISREYNPPERPTGLAWRHIWEQTIHHMEDPISEATSSKESDKGANKNNEQHDSKTSSHTIRNALTHIRNAFNHT